LRSTLVPYTTLFRSRIDSQGDEDGVSPPQTRAVGAPLQPKLGNAKTKEWLSHRLAGGRLVVDRDRRFLVMASPKRDLVRLERGRDRKSTRLNSSHVS